MNKTVLMDEELHTAVKERVAQCRTTIQEYVADAVLSRLEIDHVRFVKEDAGKRKQSVERKGAR
jgi:hypothetical protein